MQDGHDRIDALDLSVFSTIKSQTSERDRRSLLAVQRAVARKHSGYVYLEIGSHLGGSLQPHIMDRRCARIYSIDPRPLQQPDDRKPGYVYHYPDNSTGRMLSLLRSVPGADLAKLRCIEETSASVDVAEIVESPHIAFIDGEHTHQAVLADFALCNRVLRKDGVVLFHDFRIIYPAIYEILAMLDRERRRHLPLKLESDIAAIFFDGAVVERDPELVAARESSDSRALRSDRRMA